jgi:hypothetical protein
VSKYLNTKPGSLESAVLEAVSPAQQAAIAIAKKEKGEKPKNEEKMECPKCKGEGCDHCDNKGYHTMDEGSKEEYEKFFKAALKKFGVDSPADFKSDEEKKKFFDYIDKNYKGEGEKAEEVKEEVSLAELAAKHITDMWKESAGKKKTEEDEKEVKAEDEKTLTGKPMSKVEVSSEKKEAK